MYRMKRSGLFTTICLVAAALLTACTQDEGTELGTALPEGQYPLQIGGITLSAQLEQGEASPQTRVSENADGSGSVFDNNDIIKVCIGDNYDNVGDYQLAVGDDGSITDITVVTPVYWTSTQSQTVRAWYTTGTDNTVSLDNQSSKLAYVLFGQTENMVDYRTENITLDFTHKLAKVRVKLTGDRTSVVTSVEIYSYPSCTFTPSTRTINGNGNQTYIPMMKCTRNSETCWEANLVPGTIINANSFIRLNGSTIVPITGLSTLEEGAMHILTVDVDAYPNDATVIDLGSGAQTITNGTGNYVVKSGNYSNALTISGGSPHIYLDNASISVMGTSAVSITGGATATIHVVGGCTTSKTDSSPGAGMYVAEGSTVKIVGGSKSDKLTANAAIYGSGIGGYENSDGSYVNCGNIEISNVTIEARGRGNMGRSPGIGGTGTATCGNIKITNATVYAYGYGSDTGGPPAIGAGMNSMTGELGPVPSITISNSEIHAYRGGGSSNSYADWIGSSGSMSSQQNGYADSVNITSTVVYQYRYGTNIYAEGSSSFDANGNRTEHSQ